VRVVHTKCCYVHALVIFIEADHVTSKLDSRRDLRSRLEQGKWRTEASRHKKIPIIQVQDGPVRRMKPVGRLAVRPAKIPCCCPALQIGQM
jgi:hypothetical protein